MTEATIRCAKCNENYTYDDDGVSVDCMPDGVLVGGEWVCSDCMVDDAGETLPEYC